LEPIPARFAATGADAAIAITRRATNHRIGLSLTFNDARIDTDRLARAFRLSLDAEPVAGCAFRTDERRAYWQRLDDLDCATLLVKDAVEDPDTDVRSFQALEVADSGPQASVALFRAHDRDVLNIKLSHVFADGQASKRYAYLLATIYTRLGSDPAFVPEPNLRPRPTGRDVWASLTREQRREAKKAKSWTNPTWPVPPGMGSTGERLSYRWTTIPPERFASLKAYGSERGCTVNDMMLTAVLRACIALLDPPAGVPLSLMYTADLRRYLPDPDDVPLCNLSISGSLDLQRVDGEGFSDTLARVHERMGQWAQMCHGAGPLASAERLAGLGYRTTERLLGMAFRMAGSSGKTYPWFTNIGIIDEAKVSFDGATPSEALMFGPAVSGMSIVPVVSTYRDSLTVSAGFCESDMEADRIDEFLQATVRETDSLSQSVSKPGLHPARFARG
jgi:NRPS condensation-like uncharacterized protein